ncbi:MAG: DNA polymerase IV [Clostridiales Family XIII bacterium]|jgi:DNA polymerase-4|nr:DNA polymerase IV [Clostridiales Family XIII bacterium]
MEKIILHLDMNNFFASCTLLSFPQYKNLPVAISGHIDKQHGIILAKNEIAKNYGIKTAETVISANKKCKNLILLKSDYDKYAYYSKKINSIYARWTDVIEPFSIDESWLDITKIAKDFSDAEKIAFNIKGTIKKETGLTLSCGVSFNKIFAKMGSGYKKPDAITVITKENYKKTIWPLPIARLFGVGKKTAVKLISLGINTIEELANYDTKILVAHIGKIGTDLKSYADGTENSPVVPMDKKETIKSISHGKTFEKNIFGIDEIKERITPLADKVIKRLNEQQLLANGIKVEIKDPNFYILSKQKKTKENMNTSEKITNESLELIKELNFENKKIRAITVGLFALSEKIGTDPNFIYEVKKNAKNMKLDATINSIKSKLGEKSLKRLSDL